MFVHQEQLEYQLRPEQYCSPRQHEREVERLFLPGWHMVGRRQQVARPGDFFTIELFGHPVVVHNFEGKPFAFLNICAHRHCIMVGQPQGRAPTIKCQYHGWEYVQTGYTRHIPDARCFRPFDRENSRIRALRLESCGDLLFVSLVEEGPSLREYLGDRFEFLQERFSPPWYYQWEWSNSYPSNWKVPIENTLESYHIPTLHPKSFHGVYPGEPYQKHILDERFTTAEYDTREDPKTNGQVNRGVRLLGAKRTDTYTHHHVHPNLVFITMDLHAFAYVYLPTSPTTSTVRLITFGCRGTRRGPLAWIVYRLAAYFGKSVTLNIVQEDVAVMGFQQRGFEKSPHRGCIGTREERLYVFQQYVNNACGRWDEQEAETAAHRHGGRSARSLPVPSDRLN